MQIKISKYNYNAVKLHYKPTKKSGLPSLKEEGPKTIIASFLQPDELQHILAY